ncbi:MAG: CarD family transcriptional regulator [Lachnospiraceae bacterium]|nr:CarD family transcriptional regulator [Lachnospiraceae bacterium]
MFETGEYIIYGNTGVCKVEEVKKMAAPGSKTDKLYYALEPVYNKGSRLFTPVDNQKVRMRPILTRAEADELIDNIKEIDILWVTDEKNREQMYKEAIRTCNCVEWVRIIKTLYLRKKSRLAAGKKVTSSDAKYLHLAEEILYGELSVVMGIPKDEVETYITHRVHETK